MKLRRIILFLCALVMSASMMMAQSSGDRLYNQGLEAQKIMTVKSQNDAIQKFSSAKKLYDSASKKAQCDRAISVSRNIITSLSSGNGGKGSAKGRKGSGKDNKDYTEPAKPTITLSLTNTDFSLDASTKVLNVGVNTNDPEWTMIGCPCDDGSSFLTMAKSSDDNILINVPENTTTIPRKQKIQVKAGDVTEDIMVSQDGLPISLVSKTMEFTFKEKGGKKNFNIICNADQTYPDNGYENWYVESQPYWVKLIVNEKKNKGGLGKKIVGGIAEGIGLAKKDSSGSVTSNVTIIVDPLRPGSVDAHNGRRGEIVLRSGDQTITLLVYEYGKLSVIP